MKTQLSPQDWQQLSAYLDGQLSTTEKERLETRLRSQASLRGGLEEISQTRTLLRSVPRRKVPHNFILTRAMVAEQSRRRSAWFPVLSFTSLASLVVLVMVSLLYQFQGGALTAAPVAMQAARSDQAEPSQPMIIQWGHQGIGGGDGGAVPLLANPDQATGKGGGSPEVTQDNSMMKSQPTPEAGLESAPTPTEAAIPNLIAPNTGAPTEAPAATSEPALAAPFDTPAPTEQPAENPPTEIAPAQEKALPAEPSGPVDIFGIAPTQEQGLVQPTAVPAETQPAPGAPVNYVPFIQVGLIFLALTAGILAFLMRRKT